MHRAGVEGAFGHRPRSLRRAAQVFFRVGGEFGAASGRAEIIRASPIVVAMRGRVRIDLHATHRIRHCSGRCRVMAVPAAVIRPPARRMIVVGAAGVRLVGHNGGPFACNPYRVGVYIAAMRRDAKMSVLKRLQRIEGQVRGLARMVAEERYCIDVVTQVSAVRAALRAVEDEILRDHTASCVEHAIASGNKADQRRKVAELLEVLGRSNR
jgi:DNA-binding FrmR family transcriptional regulator